MDIFAHGLWAAAAAKTYNQVYGRIAIRPYKLNVLQTAFWGVFPDLFAFTIPFAWLILGPLFGDQVPRLQQSESGEPPPADSHWTFRLASILYQYSHSLVIFFTVIALIWLIRKRIPWVMGGWLLHILIDMPTHTYDFYPTPFLWPLSDFKITGISWGTPWFMIANYSSLALIFLSLFILNKKQIDKKG